MGAISSENIIAEMKKVELITKTLQSDRGAKGYNLINKIKLL